MTEGTEEEIQEEYIDDEDAYQLLQEAWQGLDGRIGHYDSEKDDLKTGADNVVSMMLKRLPKTRKSTKMLYMGSGMGYAARSLAISQECYVSCLDRSTLQNSYNLELIQKNELEKKVSVVRGNYDQINFDRESFDVVWSQETLVQSDKKDTVFYQVSRALNPGGRFIYTDLMKADDCPDESLQKILENQMALGLASVEWYKRLASRVDFERVSIKQIPDQLLMHFDKVLNHLQSNYDKLNKSLTPGYLDRYIKGYEVWKKAAQEGLLNWGILQFQKRNI